MKNSNEAEKRGGPGLLPSIDEVLGTERAAAIISEMGRGRVLLHARRACEEIRGALKDRPFSDDADKASVLNFVLDQMGAAVRAAENARIQRVINATGVVVHTNLGRAPLSGVARAALADAAGYTNIEYDIEAGDRGRRCANAERLLADLTGAEDALIVNNCAAAAMLVLSVLASGLEVLVSRGELVEIGGDFRIPDVLAESGATLKEVGTTNRTKLADYENALDESRCSLILRVHPSNYRITGFTKKPSLAELAELARSRGVYLFEDAGSGAMIDAEAFGLTDEPLISKSVADGADIVSFSGDKLLGGPQAGLIVGRKEIIDQLRRHPLYRVLRVDKLICAALEATLLSYARGTAAVEIPVLRMLSLTDDVIEERATAFAKRLKGLMEPNSGLTFEIISGTSAVGGGAAPDVAPKTSLISLTHERHSDNELEHALRGGRPPVIARIADGKVLIDLRTVSEAEESELIEVLRKID